MANVSFNMLLNSIPKLGLSYAHYKWMTIQYQIFFNKICSLKKCNTLSIYERTSLLRLCFDAVVEILSPRLETLETRPNIQSNSFLRTSSTATLAVWLQCSHRWALCIAIHSNGKCCKSIGACRYLKYRAKSIGDHPLLFCNILQYPYIRHKYFSMPNMWLCNNLPKTSG